MVATTEASVHDEHKRRIVAPQGEDTVFSSIFGPEWPHFNPMRLQRNGVVAEYNHRLAAVPQERSEGGGCLMLTTLIELLERT